MTPEAKTSTQPTPALLFDTLNAHQRTEAIKTAIELDLFTAIAEGKTKASEIAEACEASVRGILIACGIPFVQIQARLSRFDAELPTISFTSLMSFAPLLLCPGSTPRSLIPFESQ